MAISTERIRTLDDIRAFLAGNEASDLYPPVGEAAYALMERTLVMQDRGTRAPHGHMPPARYR